VSARHGVAYRLSAPLRFLWALPGSVIGFLLGAFSFALPRYDEGTLVFESRVGFAALLKRVGYTAITLGQVIVVHDRLIPSLRAHEREHVRQWMLGGPLFAVAYHAEGFRQLVTGHRYYKDNRFEVRARVAADRLMAGRQSPWR